MPRERDFLADGGTSLVKPQASLVGQEPTSDTRP